MKTAAQQVAISVCTVLLLWTILPSKKEIIVQNSTPMTRSVHFDHIDGVPSGDFTTAAQVTLPSVVHIEISEGQRLAGSGSGVIVDRAGYIVTNNHVIEDGENIWVTLHDNRRFKATLIGADPSTDLAVIKINADNIKPLGYGDSDQLDIGEWVVAVGNPFNLTSTVTAGIVSAKGREIRLVDDRAPIESFIQTDAAVNPGNSGGALVDKDGRLVGINTAIIGGPAQRFAGYSFAIPINLVSKIIDDIITYGAVKRGWLGILMYSVDDNAAKQAGLDEVRGSYISEVIPGSAAEEIGLRKGDIILTVENHPINTVSDLTEIIGRHRPCLLYTSDAADE